MTGLKSVGMDVAIHDSELPGGVWDNEFGNDIGDNGSGQPPSLSV